MRPGPHERPDGSRPAHATSAVVEDRADGGVVIILRGDLDALGVQTVQNEVRWAVANAPTSVTVDCADVGFVDSAGLRLLVEAESMASCRHERFRLEAPRGQLRTLLRLTALDETMLSDD